MSKNFKHLVDAAQMASLTPRANEKLIKWLKDHDYGMQVPDGPFVPVTQLSISQMIEFLDEGGSLNIIKTSDFHGGGYVVTFGPLPHELTVSAFEKVVKQKQELQLCDALFAAVKEILEEKN